jgi:hypothetical protein
MLQWNGYEPGFVGAVKVLVPGEAASSNALPVSEVTVCDVPSLLFTVTVAPGLTESGVEKLKSSIVIVEAVLPASEEEDADDAELDVVPEDDDEPDEPQATSATAHRPASTSRAGAWFPDITVPSVGGRSAGRTATGQRPAVRPGAGVRIAARRRPCGVPSQCAEVALRSMR